mgnify:CR=1 FL=1
MSNEMNQQPRKRGPMGRMGRGMQPGEKPKDLKKFDQTARPVHRKI